MNKLLIVLAAAFAAHTAWAAGDAAAPAVPSLQGEVLEVKEVETFTYLRLKTAKGETWAAVNKTPVKKGAKVTIDNPTVMQNFESKSLGRKFDSIVFGTLAGSKGAGGSAGAMASGAQSTGTDLSQIHGNVGRTQDVGAIKVAKAEGADARTVAEVNTDRVALRDKPVTIRAKVVKVTGNVMGKNWIHLRDGSGSSADNSDDILVTSKDEPRVGDVVLMKGVVKTDVNLGSGYAYKVLVEDASLQK